LINIVYDNRFKMKHIFQGILFLWFFIGLSGKTQISVTADVVRIDTLEISSASALEKLNDHWFVAGDDAVNVHVLDSNFNLVEKVKVASDKHLLNNRLKKSKKPDLEAAVVVPWGKDRDVLIFGSGSSSKRRKLIRIDFDNNYDFKVEKYSLKKLYKIIRKEANISKDELNIEGAALWDGKLVLLNRHNNQLYTMRFKEFKRYMKDHDHDKPEISVYNFNLPVLDGNQSGFSGCYVITDLGMLVFTATVEQEPDWVNPDEIIGSYIGILDLNELNSATPLCTPVLYHSELFPEKIESIVCTRHDERQLHLVCITDNDNGDSLLLKVILQKHVE